MNIAIFGFGTVGKGIYEIINKKNNDYLKNVNIKYIYDRKEKFVDFKNTYKNCIFTDNVKEILNDNSVNVIVECMYGVDFPYYVVMNALKNGKKVVTSNKMLLATKYDEIFKTEFTNNIFYEASAGGGIHLFKSLKDIMKVDEIMNVRCIINGTTNFILSKMYDDCISFDDALNLAKKLGFAENDPTNDICGYDAKYKIFLIHNFIFGKNIELDNICCNGIENISIDDVISAKKENKKIKLIAYTDKNEIYVKCEFVNKDDVFFNVNSNLNVIEVNSSNLFKSIYIGEGAGMFPTAHAMVLDILSI